VLTRPLTDAGEWRTLLPEMDGWVHASADGSAIVVGGPDMAYWGKHRIFEGPDGPIVTDELMDLPPVPAPVDGLSLVGDALAWTDQTAPPAYDDMFNTRTVSADAVPQVGRSARPAEGSSRAPSGPAVCDWSARATDPSSTTTGRTLS
jgi:hypothetical protein